MASNQRHQPNPCLTVEIRELTAAVPTSPTPYRYTKASPAPPAAATGRLTSLPEDVQLAYIAPYLSAYELVDLGSTSSRMLRLYGARLECIVARRRELKESHAQEDLDALRRSIGRQEALLELRIDFSWMVPAMHSALAAGGGRHLRELQMGPYFSPNVHAVVPAALTQLFAMDRLPVLEELYVGFLWKSRLAPALVALLEALGHGASPRLRTLTLNWSQDEADVPDALAVLAATLEARRARGCVGLIKLDLGDDQPYWVTGGRSGGSLDVRRRIWSVLLPTLEEIPFNAMSGDDVRDQPFIDALIEQGVPCLKLLWPCDWPAGLLRRMGQFPRLESIILGEIYSDTVDALKAAILEAGGAAHFFPVLRKLNIFEVDPACAGALGALLGQTALFPKLEELSLDTSGGSQFITDLGSALAAGLFASLRTISLDVSRMEGDLERLFQQLAAAPCARTLQKLELRGKPATGGGLQALGDKMGAGHFPVLEELNFWYAHVPIGALAGFVASLPVSNALLSPLRILMLPYKIGDTDAMAIAAALQEGRLGGQLRVLHLCQYTRDGTDASVCALATALVRGRAHVARLKQLVVKTHNMTRHSAAMLVAAAAGACPSLQKLDVSWSGMATTEPDELRAMVDALAPGRGWRMVD